MDSFYIRMRKREYQISLVISLILSIVFGYITYLARISDSKVMLLVLILGYIFFINLYRVMEYLYTKKSIYAFGLSCYGYIYSGEEARQYFFLNLMFPIFMGVIMTILLISG